MFTGIIQKMVRVERVKRQPGLVMFSLKLPKSLLPRLSHGASIAVDGVCLTVSRKRKNLVIFDAMEETLQKTTIGKLEGGTRVNVERSMRGNDEIGGHILSGHVTGMAEITHLETFENNHVVTFRVASALMKYIFSKGFIALDGVSLTIVDVDRAAATFTVHFIPETLRRTTFGWKKKGDFVNVEIDSRTQAIVETVERILENETVENRK